MGLGGLMAGEDVSRNERESASVDEELQNLAAAEQSRAESDQTGADFDQTGADFDQTFADIDQSASDRDQRASDRDQEAADRDQIDADRSGDAEAVSGWMDTRRTRSQTTVDRDISSHVRKASALTRDGVANRRDADADARDADAASRDEIMAAIDAAMEQIERSDAAHEDGVPGVLEQSLPDRRRAATVRERSALVRAAAARDRVAARCDRQRAAGDRQAAQAALALEGIDHLTGALRRAPGLEGLRRELDRTRRTNEPLTVAFIDVDGLKRVNDEHGHIAGDALLRGVVANVKRVLRPYDLIMRFGGDEFVCVLCGLTPAGLEDRFEQVAADLAKGHESASFTVGFSQATADASPEQLIARADQAMMAVRRTHPSPA